MLVIHGQDGTFEPTDVPEKEQTVAAEETRMETDETESSTVNTSLQGDQNGHSQVVITSLQGDENRRSQVSAAIEPSLQPSPQGDPNRHSQVSADIDPSLPGDENRHSQVVITSLQGDENRRSQVSAAIEPSLQGDQNGHSQVDITSLQGDENRRSQVSAAIEPSPQGDPNRHSQVVDPSLPGDDSHLMTDVQKLEEKSFALIDKIGKGDQSALEPFLKKLKREMDPEPSNIRTNEITIMTARREENKNPGSQTSFPHSVSDQREQDMQENAGVHGPAGDAADDSKPAEPETNGSADVAGVDDQREQDMQENAGVQGPTGDAADDSKPAEPETRSGVDPRHLTPFSANRGLTVVTGFPPESMCQRCGPNKIDAWEVRENNLCKVCRVSQLHDKLRKPDENGLIDFSKVYLTAEQKALFGKDVVVYLEVIEYTQNKLKQTRDDLSTEQDVAKHYKKENQRLETQFKEKQQLLTKTETAQKALQEELENMTAKIEKQRAESVAEEPKQERWGQVQNLVLRETLLQEDIKHLMETKNALESYCKELQKIKDNPESQDQWRAALDAMVMELSTNGQMVSDAKSKREEHHEITQQLRLEHHELAQKVAQLKANQAEIPDLEQQLKLRRQSLLMVTSFLRDKEAEKTQLTSSISDLNEKITQLTTDKESLEADKENKQAELNALSKQIKDQTDQLQEKTLAVAALEQERLQKQNMHDSLAQKKDQLSEKVTELEKDVVKAKNSVLHWRKAADKRQRMYDNLVTSAVNVTTVPVSRNDSSSSGVSHLSSPQLQSTPVIKTEPKPRPPPRRNLDMNQPDLDNNSSIVEDETDVDMDTNSIESTPARDPNSTQQLEIGLLSETVSKMDLKREIVKRVYTVASRNVTVNLNKSRESNTLNSGDGQDPEEFKVLDDGISLKDVRGSNWQTKEAEILRDGVTFFNMNNKRGSNITGLASKYTKLDLVASDDCKSLLEAVLSDLEETDLSPDGSPWTKQSLVKVTREYLLRHEVAVAYSEHYQQHSEVAGKNSAPCYAASRLGDLGKMEEKDAMGGRTDPLIVWALARVLQVNSISFLFLSV